MGDRICIKITDGAETSPMLYCHWAGLRALKNTHDAFAKSRADVRNVMCNLIVTVMEGECSDASYYLYDSNETDGIADYDNWSWIFDISAKKWTTTNPLFEGRSLTMQEVEDYVKRMNPCIYRGCPCELYNTDEYCSKRLWDNYCKKKGAKQ